MKWWWTLICLLFIGFFVQYERIEIDEKLCSLRYGCYPKKVIFEQGMSIMPGQSATIEMRISIPIESVEEQWL